MEPIYPKIYYREGYEFQLSRDYNTNTGITFIQESDGWHAKYKELDVKLQWLSIDAFGPFIGDHWFRLYFNGDLFISADYAWDGPSKPAIKTKSFMRGSLEHDMLYQAMREKLLSPEFRIIADRRLKEITLQDGMWSVRSEWVYDGVRVGAEKAIQPRPNEELEAP